MSRINDYILLKFLPNFKIKYTYGLQWDVIECENTQCEPRYVTYICR